MKLNIHQILSLLIIFCFSCIAQTKTNLDLLYNLIDSSTIPVYETIKSTQDPVAFEFNLQDQHKTLSSRLISKIAEKNVNIAKVDLIGKLIKYGIEQTNVEYGEVFKDGLFGSYKVNRTVNLSGSFEYYVNQKLLAAKSFNFSLTDTIDYNDIVKLENSSLPITRGTVPPEPFIPSLIEPAIAITAIVVTVILFFTVRSK